MSADDTGRDLPAGRGEEELMDEPLDLEAIEARILIGSWPSQSLTSMHADALALLAEVKRLRAQVETAESLADSRLRFVKQLLGGHSESTSR